MKDDIPTQNTNAPRSAFSRLRIEKQSIPVPEQEQNTQIKQEKQKIEEKNNELILPGIKPVLELIQEAPEKIDVVFVQKGRRQVDTDPILDACRAAMVRFSLVDTLALKRLHAGNHQGVIARLSAATLHSLSDLLDATLQAPLPLLLALDQVQDTGNVGALARTLYALGGGGLLIPQHNGVYLGAAAAKASAGALTRLPVSKVANLAHALDTAEENGFTIYGAAMSSAGHKVNHDIFQFRPTFPAILVLGSEESGLRPVTEKRCAAMIHIPMLRNFDSLNVAQAGAILISRFLEQHAAEKV